MPTAHTVLLIVAAMVAALTWVIPSGKYERLEYVAEKQVFIQHGKDVKTTYPATQATLDQLNVSLPVENFISGDVWKPIGIPGTYYQLPSNPQSFFDLLKSPLKGFINAVDVILFVLIIGGFIGIVHSTGAFNAGIAQLAIKLKGREPFLIVIVTFLTALGGTTFGLAEETIAFYPILIPVFIAAGYDALVPLASIFLGTVIGGMGATINPFSVIIASNAAGINWVTGIEGRILMFCVSLIVVLWYVIRYAERVRKDPSKSIIYRQKQELEDYFINQDETNQTELTPRVKIVLLCFTATFVIMIYGVSKLDWWFLEMTSLFFIASIVIALISGLSEKKTVDTFIKGATDLLGVALIIALARGVTVLMDDGAISDTLLYYSSNLVDGLPAMIFVNLMMFIYAGLSFFVPSSSGMAVLTMPIFAPLADTVGIGRELVVSAYLYGINLLYMISPTGLILASLTIAKIPYKDYLKFAMPLFAIYVVMIIIILSLSVYL